MKRVLKVAFSPAVTRFNDLIGRALEEAYAVVVDEAAPEVFFASDSEPLAEGRRYGKIILVAIENTWPDLSRFCGGLTFCDAPHPRNLRLPLYALTARPEELIKPPDFADRVLSEPRRFCALVASNLNLFRTRRRVEFFKALHARRAVDSGGALMNNLGYRVQDLREFYRNYRFCLAFENQAFPGYTTEKIVYAMRSGCVPIYWGNPQIADDFNPASFINVAAFRNDREAIAHVLEVADNPALLRPYLEAPYLHGNAPGRWFETARVRDFLVSVIESAPPAKNRFYFRHKWYRLRNKLSPYGAYLCGMLRCH